ncbi:MAG: 1-(5-phosphoribosyl)-5-[(5-phosphoribosylamino)methylideneamino] imidazole-4-carboxamide isomerase [Acidobacteria bacterium]|nr:1-(5-phosphoribosyl)-5-[(5-phosphoribosylamino)methylideneamino] imidazole-4-carboxamide isomerase [Acidobacteriota bacterium]
MILPCIDLMGGKVVQLRQGREKALEGDPPLEMLKKFAAFPQIQVIDLDAALGQGSNDAIVCELAARAVARVGGGVRTVERAQALLAAGACRVIVGTAAFTPEGINRQSQLEPYCSGFLCTCVDKEGMLEGTDLDWFRRLRAATRHEITAAGGITTLDEIRALAEIGIHAALGMAVYTGRLSLQELAMLESGLR